MSRRGQPSESARDSAGSGFRRAQRHLPMDMEYDFRPIIVIGMFSVSYKVKVFALLLGLIFLAAQFHFCADLSALNSSGHFCPFCSTAGAAVATHVPLLGPAPATVRLEVRLAETAVSSEVAPSTSPRAPPAI